MSPRRRIPAGGRHCAIRGKDQGASGEGLGGFRTIVQSLAATGPVDVALPSAMHAHPSCVRHAQRKLRAIDDAPDAYGYRLD